MADSLPDVILDNSWTEVYSASGITLGATIYVTNKGTSQALMFEQATAPAASSLNGIPLIPVVVNGTGATITTSSGLWMKAPFDDSLHISVQEV